MVYSQLAEREAVRLCVTLRSLVQVRLGRLALFCFFIFLGVLGSIYDEDFNLGKVPF